MGSCRRLVIGWVRVVMLVALSWALFTTTPASAQVYVGVTPPEVGAVDASSAGVAAASGARAAPGATARSSTGALAFTGGDIAGLCLLALGGVAAGLVLKRMGRPASSG